MIKATTRLGMVMALGAALLASDVARADLYRCRKRGEEKITNYKERGWACVRLDIATDPPKKPATDQGMPAIGDVADARPSPTGTSAFEAPRERFAPPPAIPKATSPGPFRGSEPEDRGGREALYAAYFDEAAELYNLPVAFLKAVARIESNFHYRATSSAGAMGVMQLMPGTARSLGVADPWDPRANILGGARFIRQLADRFDGDMVKVLAGYHAGGGAVASADGIPYEATESYVRSVLDAYYQYKTL